MDAERVGVRLPNAALAAITGLLRGHEDRSDFLREAAEIEIAVRKLDVYPELLGYLTANETLAEFCARAVRQAAQQRISMLKDSGVGISSEPASKTSDQPQRHDQGSNSR